MIPPMMVKARRSMCLKAGCTETPDFKDSCASCPAGHWKAWDNDCSPGLGTQIEMFAKPVARLVDAVLGTGIANCGGCEKMKSRLDAGMAFTEALKMRIRGQ